MTIWETLYYTFLEGKTVTEISVSSDYNILVHLFYILPLGALMFLAAWRVSKKSQKQKEFALRLSGLALILVLCLRSVWYFVFEPWEAPYRVIGFEISEFAAYACILSALFVKKDWLYKFAFPMGLISFFAAYLVPYTTLTGVSVFCARVQFTFVYHWFNGFISLMIPIARGWRPKKSDWQGLSVIMAGIFVAALIACRVQGRNWIWLSYIPLNIPILSKIPSPYYVPFLYLCYTGISIVFLDICVAVVAKLDKAKDSIMISHHEVIEK